MKESLDNYGLYQLVDPERNWVVLGLAVRLHAGADRRLARLLIDGLREE